MLLNILSSLDSFQIISHVSIIYLKSNQLNTLRSLQHYYNFTLKHEKPSIGYFCYASFICECTLEGLA